MAFITVSKGGASSEIPDGVYSVTLVDIKGPKTVTAQRGPKAGQEIQLLDWTFAVDDGEFEGSEVEASTSMSSGPRSKLYSYLTALFGGKSPAPGTGFEVSDLAGRRAIATIRTDENGWPRIDNLSAMPNTMPLRQAAVPTDNTAMVKPRRNAPVSEAPVYNAQGLVPGTGQQVGPATAAVAVATADDDLPF